MFVDSLIVFVIVAERILRPISPSESLDTEPAQLEDRGRSHTAFSPGQARTEFSLCPQGGVAASRKIK